MGRTAYGVRGIQLRDGDAVVAMQVAKPGGRLLTVTERGYAKQTELGEYRVTGRGGLGVKNVEITEKNGPVVASLGSRQRVLVITEQSRSCARPGTTSVRAGPRVDGSGLATVVSVALVPKTEDGWSRRPAAKHRLQDCQVIRADG
jgi:DNA gyrase/topoisomerase IV subunit A